MSYRNQNTLSDSQRANLQSFMGWLPTRLFDWSTPSADISPPNPISLPWTPSEFVELTSIEVQNGVAPFRLWDGQRAALHTMEHERLAVFLKARQLGISWIACAYALYSMLSRPNQTVLAYSQGKLEANELIRRVAFLYYSHQHRSDLPSLSTDNLGALVWSNRSRMLSLAATRRAGRSFTANIAILDEWAFMAWPRQTLAAVKPTIDAGGKLFIISSADGIGSIYHQFWQQAQRGENGYKAIFLPWFAHPDRGAGWRDQKLLESSGDTSSVKREYPANEEEAFSAATDAIFGVWSDGPEGGNVTTAAEYEADAGEVLWFVDDGYVGKRDQATGHWTADSHPRAFLLAQVRHDGTINIFYEDTRVGVLSDAHIAAMLDLSYPHPSYAVVDKSAAELKGRLMNERIYIRNSPPDVEESIKELRRALAQDANGRRRIKVHPRCTNLRHEMNSYRRDANGNIVKAFDHSIDALRYGAWALRYEA